MKKLFIACSILLFPSMGLALEACPDSSKPITITSNESFTLSNVSNREWVKIRLIIQKNGHIGDAKPIDFSTSSHNRKATDFIKEWVYESRSNMCYKDVTIYKTGI